MNDNKGLAYLQGNTNGRDWAREFIKIAQEKHGIELSEEWMTGWFSGAIMAGWDEGARREKTAIAREGEKYLARIMTEKAIVDGQSPPSLLVRPPLRMPDVTDSDIWAFKFIEAVHFNKGIDLDKDWMSGWFGKVVTAGWEDRADKIDYLFENFVESAQKKYDIDFSGVWTRCWFEYAFEAAYNLNPKHQSKMPEG